MYLSDLLSQNRCSATTKKSLKMHMETQNKKIFRKLLLTYNRNFLHTIFVCLHIFLCLPYEFLTQIRLQNRGNNQVFCFVERIPQKILPTVKHDLQNKMILNPWCEGTFKNEVKNWRGRIANSWFCTSQWQVCWLFWIVKSAGVIFCCQKYLGLTKKMFSLRGKFGGE